MNKTLITFFTVLFCLTSSVSWSETIDDLVERNGLYYKNFTDVPFTGKVEGKSQGSFKNGKKVGVWTTYWSNGQLLDKGKYKNGKKEGSWFHYWSDGRIWKLMSGTYKNDFKVSD